MKLNRIKTLPIKVVRRTGDHVAGAVTFFFTSKKSKAFHTGFIPRCKFFFNSMEKKKYVKHMLEIGLDREIVEQADKICGHIFNLLGSGEKALGPNIPWNSDFKEDYQWPQKYYKLIKTCDFSNRADIKVPWELSRFQHLAVLGQAYWITGDEKYSAEFSSQVTHWIRNNPLKLGVNWVCAMDAAIRAANWIIAYYYFKDSPIISQEFWGAFFGNLYLTGRHVKRNLEKWDGHHGNNHYLSDLAGLVWLGLFFLNYDDETEGWLSLGVTGLVGEMEYQVYPEGTDFEASIPYHRLVAEIFLSTTILAEKNNASFPEGYKQRLKKMCEFIMIYTKPNGLAPQVGDADDGRFHILSHYGVEEKRDHRHILGIAGEYFNRDDFRYYAGNERMDGIWLTGSCKKPEFIPKGELLLKAYPQMGYYIIRDKRLYLIIRCGKLGYGGHSHNDQLSFELNIDGQDIFIDPGTYVYTADWKERNKFRGTASHNTLQIADEEQNLFEGRNVFILQDRTHAVAGKFCIEGEEAIFAGCHEGYKQKYGVVHNREIIYKYTQGELIIRDWLDRQVPLSVNFILDSKMNIAERDTQGVLLSNNVAVRFENSFAIEPAEQSQSYGRKSETVKITASAVKDMFTKLCFGELKYEI